MSVDIFGRKLSKGDNKTIYGSLSLGFKLTDDNHYDMDNKRLCSVAKPESVNDAVSLSVMNTSIKHEVEKFQKQLSEHSKIISELTAQLKTLKEESRMNAVYIDSFVKSCTDDLEQLKKQMLNVIRRKINPL